jgi:chemotaxis protein MotB
MAAKQKCPPCEEGAPSWLVSYGDMTTLLLCFFVFLLVTAKVDVDKLSSASGYMANKMGLLPDNTKNDSQQKKEDAEKGVAGDQDQTLSIDEGKTFVLGGKDMFEKGESKPTFSTDNLNELLKFSTQIRGMRNIIEVRGHTSTGEIEGTIYRDAMDLATERARSIRNELIQKGKIQADRIRIVGCGDHEPLRSNLFVDKAQNRRVEVRVNAKYQPFNPNTVIK